MVRIGHKARLIVKRILLGAWSALGAVLLVVGLSGVPANILAWADWIQTVEEGPWRWIMGLAGWSISFSAPFLFIRIRDKYRKWQAEQRYIDFATPSYLIIHTVKPAVDKDRLLITVGKDILDAFERTCPEGVRGDGGYDRELISRWVRYNVADLLVRERSKLHWPPRHSSSGQP